MDAARLCENLKRTRPLAAQMALLACMPVRVSPAFLRLARLRLLVGSTTGEEADLWLSDLVETRSAAGFSLRRAVRDHLRGELAADADLLDAVWHRIHAEHAAWLAPRARLEEELTWRLLRDANDDAIDQRWREVVDELDRGTNAEGVARWVVRAVPDLPAGTLRHAAGRQAYFGAHLLLGDASVLGDEAQAFLSSTDFAFATRRLPRRRIFVGLIDGGLLVSPGRPIENGHEIEIPATRPLWLQVEETEAMSPPVLPRVVTIDGSAAVHVDVIGDAVLLRSIDGAACEIARARTSSKSIPRVRPPRVELDYEVELAGRVQRVQLPFVTGVLADLSGRPDDPLPPLQDRRFRGFDIDNFDARMKSMKPRAAFMVPNHLSGEGHFAVDLRFESLADFSPAGVVRQVDALAKLLGARDELAKGSMPEASVQSDPDKVRALIAGLDARISEQLQPILHHRDFQALEGAWRGLHHFVFRTDPGSTRKILVLDVDKAVLAKSLKSYLDSAWDQSPLFKKVYEEAFGAFGGEPFGCLVGDYSFDHSEADVELLGDLARIAAAAHAPFLAAASPALFGLNSWREVGRPRDLEKTLHTPEHVAWRAMRETDEARYLALTMPRFLARTPYTADAHANLNDGFAFTEQIDPADSASFVWANTAYALATNIDRAFETYGGCAAIRGVEGGGLVEHLPTHMFTTDEGELAMQCPTEVALTDRREKELSDLGLLTLVHCKNTDYAAFFSTVSLQKTLAYDHPDASAPSRFAAQLQLTLVGARFMHFLKCIARDRIGVVMSLRQLQAMFQQWIDRYVADASVEPTQEETAKRPLASAQITVDALSGEPGHCLATVVLRPRHQVDDMDVTLRFTTRMRIGGF